MLEESDGSMLEESDDESITRLCLRFYVLRNGDILIERMTYSKGGAHEAPLKSAANWDYFGLFAL